MAEGSLELLKDVNTQIQECRAYTKQDTADPRTTVWVHLYTGFIQLATVQLPAQFKPELFKGPFHD